MIIIWWWWYLWESNPVIESFFSHVGRYWHAIYLTVVLIGVYVSIKFNYFDSMLEYLKLLQTVTFQNLPVLLESCKFWCTLQANPQSAVHPTLKHEERQHCILSGSLWCQRVDNFLKKESCQAWIHSFNFCQFQKLNWRYKVNFFHDLLSVNWLQRRDRDINVTIEDQMKLLKGKINIVQ